MGEGQYKRDEHGTPTLLASKLYKYAVSIAEQASRPTFMDFLTHDLVSAAKAHATYRFLIQGRKDNKTYTLVCHHALLKRHVLILSPRYGYLTGTRISFTIMAFKMAGMRSATSEVRTGKQK